MEESEQPLLIKVMLLGGPRVGKSSLLYRYTENKFTYNYTCTIGVDFGVKRLRICDQNIKLQIWDLAGDIRYSTIISTYFTFPDGFLLFIDKEKRDNFYEISEHVSNLDRYRSWDSPPFILVGNKNDIHEGDDCEYRDLSKRLNTQYLCVSALTNENVDKMFEEIVKKILKNKKII